MNWKKRIKLALDLVQQTVNILGMQGENDFFIFAKKELTDYYQGDYFLGLSNDEQEEQSSLILSTYIKICNARFEDYRERTQPAQFEEVSQEVAKSKLVEDYFKDMQNGTDDIASMNINDLINENSIIIIDEKSSSTIG